jgi:hypothetical protein
MAPPVVKDDNPAIDIYDPPTLSMLLCPRGRPTVIFTSPPLPWVDCPVENNIFPALPLEDVPVINWRAPLTPDVPAFAVLNMIGPEVDEMENPELCLTDPPVISAVVPAARFI